MQRWSKPFTRSRFLYIIQNPEKVKLLAAASSSLLESTWQAAARTANLRCDPPSTAGWPLFPKPHPGLDPFGLWLPTNVSRAQRWRRGGACIMSSPGGGGRLQTLKSLLNFWFPSLLFAGEWHSICNVCTLLSEVNSLKWLVQSSVINLSALHLVPFISVPLILPLSLRLTLSVLPLSLRHSSPLFPPTDPRFMFWPPLTPSL